MNKICTDLEQSKKLAKILPIESVDMYYLNQKETVWEMEIKNDLNIK